MSRFTPFLSLAVSGAPLSWDDMQAAMDVILSGQASDIEIAGFLAAIRTRGETVEEISAAASAMRGKAISVDAPEDAIDTCGTGGDGANTYNISTASALVVAGCGVPVAKHGNTALSSKSGSSQVLEALGVRLDITPKKISQCIHEAKVGFMFAPLHHQATGHAAAARQGLGVRTLFNVLGPLSNPAGARRQLIGVFSKDLVRPIAETLPKLGVTSAWVVHGEDGLDEITTTGVTHVAELKDGIVREFQATPEDAGLKRASLNDIKGGEPAENAAALKRILQGEEGPYRDITVLNAAGALIVAGKAKSINAAARMAEESLDNGAAMKALQKLVELSNEPS